MTSECLKTIGQLLSLKGEILIILAMAGTRTEVHSFRRKVEIGRVCFKKNSSLHISLEKINQEEGI